MSIQHARRIPPGWLRGRGQAAAYLGLHRTTLYEYEQAGHIKPIRINSRLAMYRVADLDAAILALGEQYADQEADNRTVPARSKLRSGNLS